MSSKKKAEKKKVAPHSEAGVGGAAQPAEEAVEASPAWERGTVVQLFGLVGRPELNETAGVVVQFDEARGRYAVTVEPLDSKPMLIKPTNLRPWPPTDSAGVPAAVDSASLPPHPFNVSGEGSLAPRKDTKKKDPAPETQVCAHCLAPDGQHGVALKACIRCKAASYCGRACQTAHWRAGHKQFCVTPEERVPSLPPEEPLRASSINGPEDTSLDRADECAICLDPLGDSGPLCALPCSHKFHAACVEGLRSFGIKQVCPICRVDLPPGPEQLFEEATRRYFDVKRRVDRGEASWGALTKAEQKEMGEVLRLWRSAAEQGHAAAQGLAQAEDVRLEPVVLVRKKGAASSKAALNFVQDQKGSGAAAGGLERGQELGISRAVPAFALDGLHQHGGGLGTDGIQCGAIVCSEV